MAYIYETAPRIPDLYSRMMVDTYDDRNSAPLDTGFLSFFSRGTGVDKFTTDPNAVEINIVRGFEQLAQMQLRGMQSRPLGSTTKPTKDTAFTTIARTFPLITEYADIDTQQLDKRGPYDAVYPGNDSNVRQTRLTGLASGYHNEHQKRMIRTMEYLASRSILTGTMPALLGTLDTDLIYDFNRRSEMFITAPLLWTNAASDPLGDIDTMWDNIRFYGKAEMDGVLTGRDATQAFMAHSDIQSLADNRRYTVAMVGKDVESKDIPEKFRPFLAAGFTAYARIWTPTAKEIWMFSYEGLYENEANEPVRFMDDDLVLGFATKAICDRYFGPDDTMPNNMLREEFYRKVFGISKNGVATLPQNLKGTNTIRPEWFWYDAYGAPDWSSYTVRTQIAPIFAPNQTDAFCTLDGTVA